MTFREALVQLVKERGIGVLGDTVQYKALLDDYTGMDYKKEKRCFIEALDEGYIKKLSESREISARCHALENDIPFLRDVTNYPMTI